MADRFEKHTPSLTGPATTAFAITPDNGVDLPEVTRALYVGSTGAVSVQLKDESTAVFHNVPSGSFLPLQVKRVLTDTTATQLVGLV